VDVVFECTGAFTKREDLEAHIGAGAAFVILSAPAKGDGVETIVHGVNTPQGHSAIISCASCTTNCITPVMEILGRRIGVNKAIMTTVHAYTASQAIVDTAHSRPRRGRAGGANLSRQPPVRRPQLRERCPSTAASSPGSRFVLRLRSDHSRISSV
jgi:glyceraldehyde 3-phosphate dehydrogenase